MAQVLAATPELAASGNTKALGGGSFCFHLGHGVLLKKAHRPKNHIKTARAK